MKINDKFFSLPPFISTSWSNIRAIHMKSNTLVVTLMDGDTINIPGLTAQNIEAIFNAHTAHLETDTTSIEKSKQHISSQGQILNPFTQSLMNPGHPDGLPFRIGFSTMDGIGTALQHNSEQAGAPDLPKEILEKIGAIAKIVAPEDINSMPKPEPHCNCMHCQIARAINQSLDASEELHQQMTAIEEPISDNELNFQQWEINQTGDKLFAVINKLDNKEKYSVYLGHPVGCTCGNNGCEHILAVLKS